MRDNGLDSIEYMARCLEIVSYVICDNTAMFIVDRDQLDKLSLPSLREDETKLIQKQVPNDFLEVLEKSDILDQIEALQYSKSESVQLKAVKILDFVKLYRQMNGEIDIETDTDSQSMSKNNQTNSTRFLI